MDRNIVRQLNRLKKEVESIDKINFDKFERLLNKYKSAYPDATNNDISKTIRGIRLAIEHLNHSDNDVKRKAVKVIKSAGHSFENVKRSLKPFLTALEIVEELEARKTSIPEIIQLVDDFRLIEVATIHSLRKMGRTFGNCLQLQNFAAEYLQKIKSETSNVWVLFRQSTPVAMMNVNLKSQEIDEFEFPMDMDWRNAMDNINYELLIRILQTLDVSADNIDEFVQHGAFNRFANGRPPIVPVSVGDSKWSVYFYGSELIIGVYGKSGNLRWSRFEYSQYSLQHDEYRRPVSGWKEQINSNISLNQLFKTIRKNPQLLDHMQISLAGEPNHMPQVQENHQSSLGLG